MSRDKSKDTTIKQFSAMVSIVAFVADLITVLLFIKDLLFGYELITFTSTISQVFVIALIFTFAFLLFNYSREADNGIAGVVNIFGWLYIILAALIFMIVSYRFVMIGDYSFGEFIGYPFLVIAVGGLGYSITKNVDGNTKNFSIPFMLVALEQIVLWVIKILIGGISFSWAFAGNIVHFIIAGAIVLVLLTVDD